MKTKFIFAIVCLFLVSTLFSDMAVGSAEDADENGFRDEFEQSLVEKFCPSLVLDARDHGVSPEPVEIMGPIWFTIWSIDADYQGEALTYWIQNNANYSMTESSVLAQSGVVDASCQSFIGSHFNMPHFDYSGSVDYSGSEPDAHCDDFISFATKDQPSGWYNTYENGYTYDHGPHYIVYPPGSAFPHTVYSHLFKNGDDFVIQYYFFYPFNDFVNNHEGDWEHINVVVTSDDPDVAQISRAVYYFHQEFLVCEVAESENPDEFDFYVEDGSHPVVFVGGWGSVSNEFLGIYGSGAGSHGCYPVYGKWDDVAEIPLHGFIGECVQVDNSSSDIYQNYIPWHDIVSETRDNKYGVVLLKEIDDYNYETNPEMSWFKSDLMWGYPAVKSAGTENLIVDIFNLDAHLNLGHMSPRGPRHGGTWNVVTHGRGFDPYGGSCLTFARASDADWLPPAPVDWDSETPEVVVNHPNGGEQYTTNQTIPITWHVEDDYPDYVVCSVALNVNSGEGGWTVLASDIQLDSNGDGSFNHRVPTGNLTYEYCRIRVLATDCAMHQGHDMSDSDFSMELFSKPPGEPVIPVKDGPEPIFPPKTSEYEITQNYTRLSAPVPNPFNPATTIRFSLAEQSEVSLAIYNVNGAIIKTYYHNAVMSAGEHVEIWDGTSNRGSRVASGIYFLLFKAGDFTDTKRLIMLK